MTMNRLKGAALAFVIAAFSILAACGQATDTATTVGPSATTPSGYNFTMSLSPSVVKTSGSITVTGRVVIAATNLPVTTGPTCYFSGDVSSGNATADTTTGICVASLSVSGGAGSTGYVTTTVETQSLSAAFQVKP